MSLKPFAVAFAVVALALSRSAAAAGTCEQEVVKLCVATTCPAFCTKAGADKAQCQAECTPEARCKLALFGGQDRKDQVELETEKREQLMACLAENRAAIVVSDDLGAPKLPPASKTNSKKSAKKPSPLPRHKKPTHGHVSGTVARRVGWKAIKTESFRRRQAGKARLNPVAAATPPSAPPKPPTPKPAPAKRVLVKPAPPKPRVAPAK